MNYRRAELTTKPKGLAADRFAFGSIVSFLGTRRPVISIKSFLSNEDMYWLLGLLAICVAVFSPYIAASPTPYLISSSGFGTDFTREVMPPALYLQGTFRQTGQIPLWQPYLLSGTPLVGDPVIPLLYPLYWLIFILPLPLALNIIALLNTWWSACGVYLCLRMLSGRTRPAAFCGGIMFAFAPILTAYLGGGHWAVLSSLAWWPWLWLCFNRYWQSQRLYWMLLLGTGLAAQALNDPKYLLMSVLILSVCTLFQKTVSAAQWLRRAVFGWGIAGIVMLSLAAGQLLPVAELAQLSNRVALPFSPPNDLALLIGFFAFFKVRITEWFLFPGAAVIIFIPFGAAFGWPRHLRWWLVGLGVLLLLSMGFPPLYWLLYNFVPGYKVLRGHERWWPFVAFGLVILASYGIDQWLRRQSRPQILSMTLLLIVVVYCVGATFQLLMPQLMPLDMFPYLITFLLLFVALFNWKLYLQYPALKVIVLCTILCLDTWLIHHVLVTPQAQAEADRPTPVISYLRSTTKKGERVFFPYSGAYETQLFEAGLSTADGYDPVQLASYNAYLNDASGCHPSSYSLGAPAPRASAEGGRECPEFKPNLPMLRLLNIRYIVLPDTIPHTMQNIRSVYSNEGFDIYDIGVGYGRIFQVSHVRRTAAPVECPQAVHDIDPVTEAVIETPLSLDAEQGTLEILEQKITAQGESFRVKVSNAGLLVRSETWAPGWRALVDGVDVPVYRVDCSLQGIQISAGEHEVRFGYTPRSFVIGLLISSISVLALLIGIILLAKTTNSAIFILAWSCPVLTLPLLTRCSNVPVYAFLLSIQLSEVPNKISARKRKVTGY